MKVIFENFIIKVNFAIENKYVFESAIICGHIFTEICYNLAKICKKVGKRAKILKPIKKSMSLICMTIHKAHTMYKFREKDEVYKLQGGLTVKPLRCLKIMLCELLFSIVVADADSYYMSLLSIHDSTYHLMFIYAMEKCHNNVYLNKFLRFLEIFFTYGSEFCIQNAIFKTNLLHDLANFFSNFVHDQKSRLNLNKKLYCDFFMYFFIELANLMEQCTKREGFGKFKRN